MSRLSILAIQINFLLLTTIAVKERALEITTDVLPRLIQ